jgi:hypothetical protein
MEAMNIRIGPLAFDHADYDADGDVLYLHVGQPQPGEGEETPEGHVLRFAPGTQQIIGLTHHQRAAGPEPLRAIYPHCARDRRGQR